MKLLNKIGNFLFGSIDNISDEPAVKVRVMGDPGGLNLQYRDKDDPNAEWSNVPDQLMMTTSTIQTTRENLPQVQELMQRPEMISLSDGFRDPKLVDKEIEAKKEEPTKRPKRKLDI